MAAKKKDDAYLDLILDYVETAKYKSLTKAEVYQEVREMVKSYQKKGLKFSELLDNFNKQVGPTSSKLGMPILYPELQDYATFARNAREDIEAWDSAIDQLRAEAPPPPPALPTFDDLAKDVIGQAEAKRFIKQALTAKDDPRARALGIRTPSGVLLYGPPGTGKTMLARLIANYMALEAGVRPGTMPDAHMGFVVAGVLKDKYSGGGEKNVVALFDYCREFYRRYGRKAVLFIDEADTILSARTGSEWNDSKTYIVPSFLAQMDNVDVNKNRANPFVVLATNRPSDLDPAVLRDGRIDERISVGLPTREDIAEMVKLNMQNATFDDDYSLNQCATDVVKLSGEKTIFPIKQIMATYIDPADTEQLGLINDYVVDPSLLSQLTGATVAGLCNRIKRSAYTRGAYSIAPVDAVNAVDQMLQEARQEGAGRLMKEAAAEGSQRRLMDVTTQGVLETVTWGGSKDGMN